MEVLAKKKKISFQKALLFFLILGILNLLFGLSFTGNEIDERKAIEEILSLVIKESLSSPKKSSNPHSSHIECAPGVRVAQGYTEPGFLSVTSIIFPQISDFISRGQTFGAWFKALHPLQVPPGINLQVDVDEFNQRLTMRVGDPSMSIDVDNWTQYLMAAAGVISRVKFTPDRDFTIEVSLPAFWGQGGVEGGSGRFTFGFGVGVVEEPLLLTGVGNFFGAGCGMSVYGERAPEYECRYGGTGIGIQILNNGVLPFTPGGATWIDYGNGFTGIVPPTPFYIRLSYSSGTGTWNIQIQHPYGSSTLINFQFPLTQSFRVGFGIGVQQFRPPPACAPPATLITGFVNSDADRFSLFGYGQVREDGYIASRTPLSFNGVPYDFTVGMQPTIFGPGLVPARGSNFLVELPCDTCRMQGIAERGCSGVELVRCLLPVSYDGRFLEGWTTAFNPLDAVLVRKILPEYGVELSFTVYTNLMAEDVRTVIGGILRPSEAVVDAVVLGIFVNNLGWGYDYAWMCGAELRIVTESLKLACKHEKNYCTTIKAVGGQLPYEWGIAIQNTNQDKFWDLIREPPQEARICKTKAINDQDDGATFVVQVTDSSFPPQVTQRTFILRVTDPNSELCNVFEVYIINIEYLILAIDVESFRSSPQVKAENLREALLQKLETISKAIMSGSPRGDVEKLIRDFRSKMDGCFGGNPRDDWVINCYWQEKLIKEIDALVEAIKEFYNL